MKADVNFYMKTEVKSSLDILVKNYSPLKFKGMIGRSFFKLTARNPRLNENGKVFYLSHTNPGIISSVFHQETQEEYGFIPESELYLDCCEVDDKKKYLFLSLHDFFASNKVPCYITIAPPGSDEEMVLGGYSSSLSFRPIIWP